MNPLPWGMYCIFNQSSVGKSNKEISFDLMSVLNRKLAQPVSKKKVLLIQPTLQPPGGGNAVAIWIIEALKKEYDITVLTGVPVDIAPINRFYGTSLEAGDVTVQMVPWFLRKLVKLDPELHSIQMLCWLMRIAKRIQTNYDIVITAHNEMDLGRQAIQYIHYPWFSPLYKRLNTGLGLPWPHRFLHLIKYHYRPWRLISGYSFERMKQNLTLVNSDWTGKKVEEFYGIKTVTVYPPVAGIFPEISWENRENGFVCIGRISGEKRLIEIIDILSKVRAEGYDVHLHIVGIPEDLHGTTEYYQRVLRRVEENACWVFLHLDLSRQELVQLISRHRYGIHGMSEEHFGIASAEMMRGGCIVFVPNGGGQVEIVGNDERLLYQTNDEAVAKILRVLKHPQEQAALSEYLQSRKDLFTTERFVQRIQEIVSQFQTEGS